MELEEQSYLQNETETNLRHKTNNPSSIRSSGSHVANTNIRKNLPQDQYPFPSRRRAEADQTSYDTRASFPYKRSVIRESESIMPDRKSSRTIPERVAHFYYSLGLFCSSHPWLIILLSTLVVLFSCYPLFTLPFLGNKPKEFVTPLENHTYPPITGFEGDWPRWYRGPPAVYIQQVIIKSSVLPWNSDLIPTDAFRGPLAEVFHVTDLLRNFRLTNESENFSQLCFTVGEVKSKVLKGKISMLPEFGCLIVSPADFWQQKYEAFREDPDIMATILNFQSHQKGRSGLAEILLGMTVRDTGLKRFPLKARQRIVSYAVTFVLQTYNRNYIDGLRSELLKLYPLKNTVVADQLTESFSVPVKNNVSKVVEDRKYLSELDDEMNIIHVYYPSQSSIFQLIPLVVTYIAMFVYVYFSVKKVELITSKLGMAVSALATVVASLCMSVGLCTHFGMTFEVNPKAIYPYLVVVIGLENILVLTRSVVSTAKNLDMKIRVAQGLSKEGWSITKNLLTEITILTIGFFTFIPVVQEFCILAIVGLLSDFFLQTFFFSTVLSIDVHRRKLSPDSTRDLGYAFPPLRTPIHPSGIQRVKSNPQLKDLNGSIKKVPSGASVSVVAPSHNTPILVKIPKRLRLIYFWAKTRFFQRTFTIFMIGWISVIIYESGIVAHFHQEPEDVVLPLHHHENEVSNASITEVPLSLYQSSQEKYGKPIVQVKGGLAVPGNASSDDINTIQHNKVIRELNTHSPYIWRRLTPYHWQVLFGVYNISLTGKYISILPSICVSVPVEPKVALAQRHPHESAKAKNFNWHALANPFDPMDLADEYDSSMPTGTPSGKLVKKGLITSSSDDPYIPSSPVELALTMLLAIPSIIFIAYLFVVLYKCVCSRNYAEWRSSWEKGTGDSSQDHYTQVVCEAVPLVLDGHLQDVECMGSDGNIIASVCLAGFLKVWQVTNGENIVTVDRRRYFEEKILTRDLDDSTEPWHLSDGDSVGCSPPNDSVFQKGLSISSGSINIQLQNRNPTQINFQNLQKQKSIERPASLQIKRSPSSSQGIPIPGVSSVTGPGTNSSPNKQGYGSRHSPVNPTVLKNKGTFGSPNSNINEFFKMQEQRSSSRNGSTNREPSIDSTLDSVPSIWCLDCQENLVVLGTETGRVEVWDAYTGGFKCMYEDGNLAGIVCVKLVGSRIISARLNGSLDFLELEHLYSQEDARESPSPYHRWQTGDSYSEVLNRGSSTYSVETGNKIQCVWVAGQKAHQQPITCLDCEGGRILTGSQDHTLKVFRLEDYLPLYTLHGHYGPITCLFIDKFSPMTSGSGCQSGLLCVWDLLTGMCMYSIQAHDGPVSSLTYSASYIISVGGQDCKICIWERFQGHLLNTIQLDQAYCSSLVMLTHNLLITSKQGSGLVVWDVRTGQAVRVVRLGHRDNAVFVRQIMGCADAVLCDYGSQLRLVRFPSVVNKYD